MINTILSGKYYITELIGTGGMANVYKAKVLGSEKTVAIKILKDEYTEDKEFVRRFRSEAQAVLYLSHENIVRLVDVGREDDKSYIVLEYVEGKTLKQLIREQGKLTEQDAIQVAIQMCDALSHAHENHIIHRDIKPQNILMDQSGQARLADFGIARRSDAATMTFSGSGILGSVHYLSPEQARGVQVDEKSDIYSLGIVLFEMVTGTVPFDSENTLSVALMHVNESVVPPVERNPELGKALNDIILKATQKERRKRYASAREMKRDLLRALKEPSGDFVTMDEGNMTSRIRRKKGSSFVNILRLALAMLVVLGLLITLFIIGRTAIQRARQDDASYIPNLLDKTLEAAQQDAAARGFSVEERSTQPNDEYPEGRIFSQEPRAGAKGKAGDSIFVDISSGPSSLAAPTVEGIPLEEAQRTLADWGLEAGLIEYEYSDLPEGTVIRQMPQPDTPMQSGDAVDLWVSGIEGQRNEVPSLVDKDIEDAIKLAAGAGFERLVIRFIEPEEGIAPGRVLSQSPQGGELVLQGRAIEVEIAPLSAGEYTVEVAYNIDVLRNNSPVLVVLRYGIAEYVVFEENMPSGRNTIPLTLTGHTPGEVELIIYVDGDVERRVNVTFAEGG